jgi:SAM-dependent methyltransferase
MIDSGAFLARWPPEAPSARAAACGVKMVRMGAVYDEIGGTYSRYRRADQRVAAHIERALGGARRVLDVGGGTGSYETGRRWYVAAEPSRVMLAQRAEHAAPAVQATAERLPFAAGSFDGAIAIFTVHHWPDRGAGLREVRRLTDGPIVILTSDDEAFDEGFWLREYLPAPALDTVPHVTVREITDALGPCRIEPVPVPHDCEDGFFAAYWRRPWMYLDPGARAAISALALLAPDVVDSMSVRLRADLESGEWHRRHHDLLDLDEYDCGYRLVVSDPAVG